MPYDRRLYLGAAAYYARGRPPYSADLAATLRRELGLDGAGRLLDVGCGPGTLTVELAGLFEAAVGVDPDAAMLAEAAAQAAARGVGGIEWVRAVAEEIATLRLGRFRVITFGQSFHWTEREAVAEAAYDLLLPGGSLVLVDHTVTGRPRPPSAGYPPMPHGQVRQLVEHYLGPVRRDGTGPAAPPADRHADALARTRFGPPRTVFAPGRADLVRDIDSVVANYHSMSWAAPHMFGDDFDRYETQLRALLRRHAPDGRWWDWPGDTELTIATRPT
jgi:SAM-dependent methyltransferase